MVVDSTRVIALNKEMVQVSRDWVSNALFAASPGFQAVLLSALAYGLGDDDPVYLWFEVENATARITAFTPSHVVYVEGTAVAMTTAAVFSRKQLRSIRMVDVPNRLELVDGRIRLELGYRDAPEAFSLGGVHQTGPNYEALQSLLEGLRQDLG